MNIRIFIKNNRDILSRLAYTILAAVLIFYSIPHDFSTTSITYREGTPWGYSQVITEFGFPVAKSKQQIDMEKDSVIRHFSPYFNKDGNKLSSVLDSLKQDSILNTPSILNKIHPCYEAGVMSDYYYKKLNEEEKENINIIIGNIVESEDKNIINIYTPSDIIDDITSKIKFPDSLSYKLNDIERFLKSIITENLIYNDSITKLYLTKELEKVKASDKYVKEGESIIIRGEIVSHEKAIALDSYYRELEERNSSKSDKMRNTIGGQLLIILLAFTILFWYLNFHDKEHKQNTKKFILTVSMTGIFPIIAGLTKSFELCNEYILPFTLTPMILSLFTDNKTSIIAHTISVLICSLNATNPYEFILLQLFAGYIATFLIRDLSSRTQMFHCVLLIFLTYSISFWGYTLITEKTVSNFDFIMLGRFAINSLILLFTYPLMFVIEQLFGFISSITLIELSNVNNKLLTNLSQNAPGTFQHSMQVGNLASEAAQKIGANSLLVRIGALYHDIGKVNAPIYFTENQNTGISPHSSLSPLQSVKIIIKHVTDGIAIADKHNLPRPIKDFIVTHHGQSKPGVFYFEYKKQHPDEEIDDVLFTYPGPIPFTAEQGILMLADSVEAASKSLKEYTAANISDLVEKIVDSKVNNHELDNCPLTFQNIRDIKECFKQRLMAINHTRISYPKEATEVKNEKKS